MPLGMPASMAGKTEDASGFCGVSGSLLISRYFLQLLSPAKIITARQTFIICVFITRFLKLKIDPASKIYAARLADASKVDTCTTKPAIGGRIGVNCRVSAAVVCDHQQVGTGNTYG